jgi:hypothetical protein
LRTEEDIKPVVAEAMEAQEYDTRSEAEGTISSKSWSTVSSFIAKIKKNTVQILSFYL